MSQLDQYKKRLFDIVLAAIGICFLWRLVALCIPLARWSTGSSGVFKQRRVGRMSKPFVVYKLRTMRSSTENSSTVTVEGDERITKFGTFLRKSKLDEIPQLWNVIKGEMSFVGPRPDVPGFADS